MSTESLSLTVAGADGRPARKDRRWAGLFIALLGAFMNIFDGQVVNLALPTMQKNLGLDNAALQWVMAVYVLTFALTMITGGRLGDMFGRKKVFMIGVAGFTLSSVLAGFAGDAVTLIVARALQGVASALTVPQVMSFIQVDFKGKEQGQAFALYGMTYALAGVTGPLIGGLLTGADLFGLGWRSIFLINLPIGVLTFWAAARTIRESTSQQRAKLDPVGIIIITAALFAVIFPLIQGESLGWPVWIIVLLVAALPLFALFAVYEKAKHRRDASALIPPELFKSKTVVGGLLVTFLFLAGSGIFFVINLYLQIGLGYDPMHTALISIPGSIGVVLGSTVAMKLLPRFGRAVPITGCVLMAAGMGLYAVAIVAGGDRIGVLELLPAMLVSSFGIASVTTTVTSITVSKIDWRMAGAASGSIGTVGQIGGVVSVAVSGLVLFDGISKGMSFAEAAILTVAVEAAVFLVTIFAALLLPKHDKSQAEQHAAQPQVA